MLLQFTLRGTQDASDNRKMCMCKDIALVIGAETEMALCGGLLQRIARALMVWWRVVRHIRVTPTRQQCRGCKKSYSLERIAIKKRSIDMLIMYFFDRIKHNSRKIL